MQIQLTVSVHDAKFLVDALGRAQRQNMTLEKCYRKDFLKDPKTLNADDLEAYADSYLQLYRAGYLIDTFISLIEQAEKSEEVFVKEND